MYARNRILSVSMAVAASIALAACGGGGESEAPAAQTGSLSIGVTDAPVDSAAKVMIRFTSIELKREGQSPEIVDIEDRTIDVLELAGGKTAALLDSYKLPAGRYEWVRLLIETSVNSMGGSYIELGDGRQFPLLIPSGAETGLKLVRGFTIAAGGTTSFTIDFDLRSSLHAPPGQGPSYVFRPVLRMIDNLQVGTLSGSVEMQKATAANCTPFVYAFRGAGVAPDDIDTTEPNPVASVRVVLDSSSGQYRYRIPFLEAGEYTASFTCDGAKDAPEVSDTLVFAPADTANVTVVANQTTTKNF